MPLIEPLGLTAVEINRARQLMAQPRRYVRHRVEEIDLEDLERATIAVSQTIIIPALPDDFPFGPNLPLDDAAQMQRPRLVTLGTFRNEYYPHLDAWDANGHSLVVLEIEETARMLGAILVTIARMRYADAAPRQGPGPWEEVELVLASSVVPVLTEPARYPSRSQASGSWTRMLDELVALARAENPSAKAMLSDAEFRLPETLSSFGEGSFWQRSWDL